MGLFKKIRKPTVIPFDEDFYFIITKEIAEMMVEEKITEKKQLDYFSNEAGKIIFNMAVEKVLIDFDLANETNIVEISEYLFGIGMFAVFYQMRLHKAVNNFGKKDIVDLFTIYENNGCFEAPLKLARYTPDSRQAVTINKIIKFAASSYIDKRSKVFKKEELISFLMALYQVGITIADGDMKARGVRL